MFFFVEIYIYLIVFFINLLDNYNLLIIYTNKKNNIQMSENNKKRQRYEPTKYNTPDVLASKVRQFEAFLERSTLTSNESILIALTIEHFYILTEDTIDAFLVVIERFPEHKAYNYIQTFLTNSKAFIHDQKKELVQFRKPTVGGNSKRKKTHKRNTTKRSR
jgi:hypothetical protein